MRLAHFGVNCGVLLVIGAAGVSSTGCTTLLTSISNPRQVVLYHVEVISEPPGARIEVNDDYVGDAPLVIKMAGNSKRCVSRDYSITALPVHTGHYVQFKHFRHDTRYYAESDPIPKRILFDMRLGRRADIEVDVNLND